MAQLFVKKMFVENVRHLRSVSIEVADDDPRLHHIMFTGKNGSGKTSLLDAIAGHIDMITRGKAPDALENDIGVWAEELKRREDSGEPEASLREVREALAYSRAQLESTKRGVDLMFNVSESDVRSLFERGECVFAYFPAQRKFSAEIPRAIEKVSFEERYGINDSPRDLFIKYLLDMKMTQALAQSNGCQAKADEIQRWFDRIEGILREIYEDPRLSIEFDEDSFEFHICESGREPFGFNSASDGFSAVLDIVIGVMLRMTRGDSRRITFDMPGIVLVDEVENHLHLSLQKRIVPFLTELFPNVQFIISTHSPFVLSSVNNSVVFDLEHREPVEGLADNTYGSIVEGYFNVDALSSELRGKYDRYCELAKQSEFTDAELVEIADLELYLDEIPDYLALDIATEYKKVKTQLHVGGAGAW